MLRGGERANEWHLCAGVNGNALAAQLSRVQGVLYAELHWNIANDDRHTNNFGVRMLERHDDSDDVIGCGIGVDPHAAGWAHARIVSAVRTN